MRSLLSVLSSGRQALQTMLPPAPQGMKARSGVVEAPRPGQHTSLCGWLSKNSTLCRASADDWIFQTLPGTGLDLGSHRPRARVPDNEGDGEQSVRLVLVSREMHSLCR